MKSLFALPLFSMSKTTVVYSNIERKDKKVASFMRVER